MPILNYEGEVIGVAQIINKTTGNNIFTVEDEAVSTRIHLTSSIHFSHFYFFLDNKATINVTLPHILQ